MKWFKGLIAAVIGGAANAVTLMIVDPMVFNLETGWQKLLGAAAVNALVAGAMYLKQSPVPNGE